VGRTLQIDQKPNNGKLSADTSTRSISSASSRYNTTLNAYEPKTEKLREEESFGGIAVNNAIRFIVFYHRWCVESFRPKEFLDSLFECVAAVTTTGLSAGIASLNMDMISKILLLLI